MPSFIGFSYLCDADNKIRIHRSVYSRVLQAAEMFISQGKELVTQVEEEFHALGAQLFFFVVIHTLRGLGESLSEDELKEIYLSLKKEIADHLELNKCTPEMRWFYKTFFQNPLLIAGRNVVDLPYQRTAALLELPEDIPELDAIPTFIEERFQSLKVKLHKTHLESQLYALLCLEDKAVYPMIFPLLGREEKKEAPFALQNPIRAHALGAYWRKIEECKIQALALEGVMSLLHSCDFWSYGCKDKFIVVVCLNVDKQVVEPHYAWGGRLVIPFSSIDEAIHFIHLYRPSHVWITATELSYPSAPECSEICLRKGWYIDERAIWGTCKDEKIFFNHGFYVHHGTLYKQEGAEDTLRQEQARKELEELFIDFDEEG